MYVRVPTHRVLVCASQLEHIRVEDHLVSIRVMSLRVDKALDSTSNLARGLAAACLASACA